MIRRKRHLDVERIAGPWHVFRTIRWHPTDQDAGAADVFDDPHGSAGSFAAQSDAAFECEIHTLVRTLLQAKGWTAVVLLSLALGIGANTALFSAINGLYLRKLPVREPDTLVRFKYSGRNDVTTSSSDYGFSGKDARGQNIRSTFSYSIYRQFLVDNTTLDDLFVSVPVGAANIIVDGHADDHPRI